MPDPEREDSRAFRRVEDVKSSVGGDSRSSSPTSTTEWRAVGRQTPSSTCTVLPREDYVWLREIVYPRTPVSHGSSRQTGLIHRDDTSGTPQLRGVQYPYRPITTDTQNGVSNADERCSRLVSTRRYRGQPPDTPERRCVVAESSCPNDPLKAVLNGY